jgi:hypothetical protein
VSNKFLIKYWTHDNWDGDPEEMMWESETKPTQGELEAFLFTEIQSMKIMDAVEVYNSNLSACHQYGLCVSKSFEPDIIQQSRCDRCSVCPRKKE